MLLHRFLNRGPSLLVLALSACATRSTELKVGPGGSDSAVLENAARHGFVDVRTFRPDIPVELRYGTVQNVTAQALYPADMPCLLQRATAEKLAHAQDLLRPQGLGLKIWDAWRPPEVQAQLFRFAKESGRPLLFVNPEEAWSYHCSGTAVDVTLVDAHGLELPMPTSFDELEHVTPPASSVPGEGAMRNARILRDSMMEAGFDMIDLEWWHYDDASFKDPPNLIPAIFAKTIGLALPGSK